MAEARFVRAPEVGVSDLQDPAALRHAGDDPHGHQGHRPIGVLRP